MAPGFASLYASKPLRTVVGTVGVLAVLVVSTGMTLRTVAPVAFVLIALMAHDVVSERYDLPRGTNWLVYGASVFVAGTYLVVTDLAPWAGGLLALAGLWFVFDGVTTIRYEPSRTEHEYVSDLDEEMGDLMLRVQTSNVVYRTLADAPEPRTATEVAADVDLTESRVESALGYLESEGRIERAGDRYRAEPPRWGRLTPVVEFLGWLPRRVVHPFHRVTADA